MKRIFIVLSWLILSISAWAQTPEFFSYQAVVRGSDNLLVFNKHVGMKISFLQGSENGTIVFVELHKPKSNENGIINIAIGGGTNVSGTFANIDWSKGPYFVKIETDPDGGGNYKLISTTQLLSVPYALSAANSQPGPKGEIGDPGPQGLKGDRGLQGLIGDKGITGATGPKGLRGIQGSEGVSKDQQKLSKSTAGDTLYLENGGRIVLPDTKTFEVFSDSADNGCGFCSQEIPIKRVSYEGYNWYVSVHGRSQDYTTTFKNGQFIFDCNFRESDLEYYLDSLGYYHNGSSDVIILMGMNPTDMYSSAYIDKPTKFYNIGGKTLLWGARIYQPSFNFYNAEKSIRFSTGYYAPSCRKVWLYVGIKKSSRGSTLLLKNVKIAFPL
jgi:hypothetical protein